MHQFIKSLFMISLSLTFAGCVATTMDPAVGKADYARIQEWKESMGEMDDAVTELLEHMEERDRDTMNRAVDAVVDKMTEDLKRLKITHVEVKALEEDYIRFLKIAKTAIVDDEILGVLSAETEEKIQMLLEKIEAEEERLEKKFGL